MLKGQILTQRVWAQAGESVFLTSSQLTPRSRTITDVLKLRPDSLYSLKTQNFVTRKQMIGLKSVLWSKTPLNQREK